MNFLCPLCKKNKARLSSTYPSVVVCFCSGKLLEVGSYRNKIYHAEVVKPKQKLYIFPISYSHEIDNLIQDHNRRYNIYNALNDYHNKVVAISTSDDPFRGFQSGKNQIIVAVMHDRDIKLWFNDLEQKVSSTMFSKLEDLEKFLEDSGLLQND